MYNSKFETKEKFIPIKIIEPHYIQCKLESSVIAFLIEYYRNKTVKRTSSYISFSQLFAQV